MHKLSILKITGLFFKQSLGRNFAGVNSDLVQNPEWAKSRNGQNPELVKILNWTKSRIGQNPEWKKSRMNKIQNRTNFKDRESRD